MNIKIAKAFRTTSSESLCILAGTTPIIIRTEEAAKQYFLKRRKGALTQSIEQEVDLKTWPHPAGVAAFIEVKEYDGKTIQMGAKMNKGSAQEWQFSLKMNSLQD